MLPHFFMKTFLKIKFSIKPQLVKEKQESLKYNFVKPLILINGDVGTCANEINRRLKINESLDTQLVVKTG